MCVPSFEEAPESWRLLSNICSSLLLRFLASEAATTAAILEDLDAVYDTSTTSFPKSWRDTVWKCKYSYATLLRDINQFWWLIYNGYIFTTEALHNFTKKQFFMWNLWNQTDRFEENFLNFHTVMKRHWDGEIKWWWRRLWHPSSSSQPRCWLKKWKWSTSRFGLTSRPIPQ